MCSSPYISSIPFLGATINEYGRDNLLKDAMECKDLVQKEGLFSINEELDDISTESLKVNTEMKHSIPAAISFFECLSY